MPKIGPDYPILKDNPKIKILFCVPSLVFYLKISKMFLFGFCFVLHFLILYNGETAYLYLANLFL